MNTKTELDLSELLERDVDEITHLGAYLSGRQRLKYFKLSINWLRSEKLSIYYQVKLLSFIQSILSSFKTNTFQTSMADDIGDILISKLKTVKNPDIENLCVIIICLLVVKSKDLSLDISIKIKKVLQQLSKTAHYPETKEYAKIIFNENFFDESPITKAKLIKKIGESEGIPKHIINPDYKKLFGYIAAAIKTEKRFDCPGFGTFTVRKRKARTGRNPLTGEKIKIKASKTVGFKPAPKLKRSL